MKTSGFDEIGLCSDMLWKSQFKFNIGLFGCDGLTVLRIV